MTNDTSRLAASLEGLGYTDRIRTLMFQPPPHDFEWLEAALQSAVSVELATIPPYLCALWSIKDDVDQVARSIRNVVQEEMLHMSLACNMLTAIGCVPKINDPKMVPQYPGKLPGAIEPDLCVSLSGLSDDSLDVFLRIERPSPEAMPDADTGGDAGESKGFQTIGDFYDAILDTFADLKPQLSVDRQIAGPLAYVVMRDLDAVKFGIGLIKDQGEGSTTPFVDRTQELAHYYRFLEIRHGIGITGENHGKPVFDGPPIPRPDVWPMAPVPTGGYLQDKVTPDVWELIDSCDRTFTHVLDRLQATWEFGDQGALINAIETMFELSEKAAALMSREIPECPGQTYGPCFRVV